MSQQVIDHGTVPGDGTGEPLFTSFEKTNANDAELYALTAALAGSVASKADAAAVTSALAAKANTADIADELALAATAVQPGAAALTGTPTAPTADPGTDTTQIATTAYVRGAVAALVDSSPGTLDTLNELAEALGDDPDFAATTAAAIAAKANANNAALTGTPTGPTAAVATHTTQLATTAFARNEVALDLFPATGVTWTDGRVTAYTKHGVTYALTYHASGAATGKLDTIIGGGITRTFTYDGAGDWTGEVIS